jgi:hypothetical protein
MDIVIKEEKIPDPSFAKYGLMSAEMIVKNVYIDGVLIFEDVTETEIRNLMSLMLTS